METTTKQWPNGNARSRCARCGTPRAGHRPPKGGDWRHVGCRGCGADGSVAWQPSAAARMGY
jgi:hypothetical protein